MSNFTAVANNYLAAWNEDDADRRKVLVRELWAEDGDYVDPQVSVRGHEEIEALLTGARAQFAGFEFRLSGVVDGHHDRLRFTWELFPPNASESIVEGFDVVALADDGRIASVSGFLNRVPEGM